VREREREREREKEKERVRMREEKATVKKTFLSNHKNKVRSERKKNHKIQKSE
jgi:hypothetical protein